MNLTGKVSSYECLKASLPSTQGGAVIKPGATRPTPGEAGPGKLTVGQGAGEAVSLRISTSSDSLRGCLPVTLSEPRMVISGNLSRMERVWRRGSLGVHTKMALGPVDTLRVPFPGAGGLPLLHSMYGCHLPKHAAPARGRSSPEPWGLALVNLNSGDADRGARSRKG